MQILEWLLVFILFVFSLEILFNSQSVIQKYICVSYRALITVYIIYEKVMKKLKLWDNYETIMKKLCCHKNSDICMVLYYTLVFVKVCLTKFTG